MEGPLWHFEGAVSSLKDEVFCPFLVRIFLVSMGVLYHVTEQLQKAHCLLKSADKCSKHKNLHFDTFYELVTLWRPWKLVFIVQVLLGYAQKDYVSYRQTCRMSLKCSQWISFN